MTPPRLRRLGRSAVEVTELALGGAPLGNLFAPVAEADARATLEAGWAHGIRYIDTAPHYGQGLSEHRVGAALRAHPRSSFVLSTKVGRLMLPDPARPREVDAYVDALPFRPAFDYSRDGALRSIEHSLLRLGLARIDIVYIHDIDRTHGAAQPARFREAMDGAFPALAELRAQGVIGAVGLGVNDWQVCRDALAHGDFDGFLLAGRYTLLDQSALPELLPLCTARGASIVLGGPYNSGILAAGPVAGATYAYAPAPPAILERVRGLDAVCRRHGVPLAAAALRFPLAHPAVVCVIPGARTAAEVAANHALFATPIPAALWAELKAEGLLGPDVPVPLDPI